jgi:hypothetical protein
MNMAIERRTAPKAPTQNPVAFYEGKQQGGPYGKPERVGERLKSGPMREKMGRKGL